MIKTFVKGRHASMKNHREIQREKKQEKYEKEEVH